MKIKHKKILTATLSLLLLLGVTICLPEATIQGAALISNSFVYELTDDGNIRLTGYNGNDKALVIPAKIDDRAVTVIGDDAFSNKTTLESVAIPESVVSIGNYAFNNCPSLKTVFISKSVLDIGAYALTNCDLLTNIFVNADNPRYRDENGVLLSKDGAELICCPGGRYGKFDVPAGIKKISRLAFYWCTGLEIITLPDGISEIGVYAFEGCNKIESINIPAGIKTIEKRAFAFCSSISEITLPDSVVSIGEQAFFGCSALGKVTVPDSVASISPDAFCRKQEDDTVVILPNLTIRCGASSYAFNYCRENGIRCELSGEQKPSSATTTNPRANDNAVRLAGDNRIGTAIEISKDGWGNSATVIIANAYSYADALAGVPLAEAVNAPILLTSGSALEREVITEIKRLGARKAYILGGTLVINESVQNSLKQNNVAATRLSGANRYETAIAIAKELELRSDRSISTFFVASAANFPDALAISPVAAIQGNPIVYISPTGKVDDKTAEFICGTSCRSVMILGGLSAVSKKGEDSIKQLGFTIGRLYGSDRYDTALAVCQYYDNIFTGKGLAIATGANFPDALAGGALAARYRIPLALISNSASIKVHSYIKDNNHKLLYVFGGESVVADGIITYLLH